MNNTTAKFLAVFLFSILISGFTETAEAQTNPRDRVIITKPGASPTPTPQATPSATPQTLSYLRSRIAMTLANPLLKRGRVGVKVISMRTGRAVYERNSENYFMPASNMKSFSVAAALDKLGSNFRFKTSVYANERPDSSGTIIGDLIIYGRGDPSFSTAFSGGDYYQGLDALADKIVQAGVKKVNGNLIGDETYFNAKPIPFGWEWDDLQWYYGAEISALSINDNAIDLKILPSTVGSPLVVQISPSNRLFKIINTSKTTTARTRRQIRVHKRLGQNVIEVSGTMPRNDRGYKGSITVTRPAKLFVELLKQRLQLKGVTVRGATRAVNLLERNGEKLAIENYTELANLQSPPLSYIAAKTMKPSQNLYTELILRALGEAADSDSSSSKTSAQKGISVVQETLRKAGVTTDSVVQYDASGLSRHNLITPNASAMLYKYMDRSLIAPVWRNSLTIGGVDGTLRRRFKNSAAQNNVRGKTGTLDQVSALSGYVTSKSGERFVFSIITNNIRSSRLRARTIDDIVLHLANFDGRTF